MQQALVIGTATSVVKHESLAGQKLLLAVVVSQSGREVESDPMIVFDVLGAGVGDVVLISSDGAFTGNEIIGTRKTPARWAVIGIIDRRKKEEELP